MKLIDKVKADSISARKQKSPEAAILGMLLSGALVSAKDSGNRDVVDEDVVKVAKKLSKQAEEVINILDKNNKDSSVAKAELEVLSRYTPTTLSEQETQEAVDKVMLETNATSMKDMGTVMALLKTDYGDAVDMKVASKYVKEKLARA